MSARAICLKYSHPVHHLVPHPLSRICAGALSLHRRGDGLSLPALVPSARHRDDGGDALAQARTGEPRLPQCAHLVARRGHRSVPPHRRRGAALSQARSGFMSAGWRWRRTSRLSSSWTCRAPRWWSATARRAPALERAYPAAKFLGPQIGEPLVEAYAASDVFVFPSRTDTFGLVILEALACGTPVAAYPVQGPKDVVGDAPVAALDEDLAKACRAGAGNPARGRQGVRARPFLAGLHPAVPLQPGGREPSLKSPSP